jgi:hypothetical protein
MINGADKSQVLRTAVRSLARYTGTYLAQWRNQAQLYLTTDSRPLMRHRSPSGRKAADQLAAGSSAAVLCALAPFAFCAILSAQQTITYPVPMAPINPAIRVPTFVQDNLSITGCDNPANNASSATSYNDAENLYGPLWWADGFPRNGSLPGSSLVFPSSVTNVLTLVNGVSSGQGSASKTDINGTYPATFGSGVGSSGTYTVAVSGDVVTEHWSVNVQDIGVAFVQFNSSQTYTFDSAYDIQSGVQTYTINFLSQSTQSTSAAGCVENDTNSETGSVAYNYYTGAVVPPTQPPPSHYGTQAQWQNQTFVSQGQLTIAPRVCTTPLGAVTQAQQLQLSCVDKSNNNAVVPCDSGSLQASIQENQNSGGHNHDDGQRPVGSLATDSDPTGAPSCTAGNPPSYSQAEEETSLKGSGIDTNSGIIYYFPPEIGGQVTATINAKVNGQSADPTTLTLQIGPSAPAGSLTQFSPLSAGKLYYNLTGSNTHENAHPGNNYGSGTFDANLDSIAFSWFGEKPMPPSNLPIYPLAINDMSLVDGGVFDYTALDPGGASWLPPHKAHRFGIEADIGSGQVNGIQCSIFACWIPQANRRGLLQILKAAGYRTIIEGKCQQTASGPGGPACDHWHIRPTWF